MRRPRQFSVFIGVMLLFLWVVIGTAGYVVIEGWSFRESFYMTVITLSTVGYREVRLLTPNGQLFTSFIIVGGLVTAIYTLSRIGQAILEGELAEFLGQRRMKNAIDNLKGHFIVCGFGRVGLPVAEGLQREGVPFCVVESNADLERELRERGYLYLIGDATEEETLEAAGIYRAANLLALLGSDADNLYLVMMAREMNRGIKIVARAQDEKAEVRLKRGGADSVITPNKIASMRFIHAAIRPTVVEFMELVTRRQHLELQLEELSLHDGSPLDGLSIEQAEIRKRYGLIIVAMKHATGSMVFNPAPSETIKAGDTLVAMGKEGDLKRLQRDCEARGED